ncbi:DMT family transporter [Pelagibius sp. CAU 1746]|uniref:DMT family transporter n=1 Tax=Pelagibius sp. CAU 1746 TaxID=3140370 RepID=UPI00325BBA69
MRNSPFFDLGLYGATVLIWGTTWIVMKYQVGPVAPEVSVAYRFTLAAAVVFLWARAARQRLGFGLRVHLLMAAMGICMFSFNFYFFYRAAAFVTSGLLAVVFSMTVVMNIINGRILLGRRAAPRTLAAASLGVAGIVVLFWPEVSRFDLADDGSLGLLLALAGTLCFSLGNIASARAQMLGLPVLSCNAWGMAYGAAGMYLLALLGGAPFILDTAPAYLGGLLYLALCGSVLAFGAYLTLLGRIGADRAAYATVLFPLVALAISTVVEDYVWTPTALAGVALVMMGNLLVLLRARGARPQAAAE